MQTLPNYEQHLWVLTEGLNKDGKVNGHTVIEAVVEMLKQAIKGDTLKATDWGVVLKECER